MATNKEIGTVGAIALLFGAFCPVLYVPVAGNVNLFREGLQSSGGALMFLALWGLIAARLNGKKQLWIITALGGALVLFEFGNYYLRVDEAKRKMLSAAADAGVYKDLTAALAQSIELQWGWVILFVGILCLGAAATRKEGN